MLLNTRQVVYWLSRDQYKQQRLSRPQHRSKSKSKFVLLFYCTNRKTAFINRKTAAPRSAPPFNFSLFISYFPCDSVASKLHVQIFKQWRKKEKSPFLFTGPGLPVSLSPNGPSAAEVCGNNHPPTVCSLAASPALCMGLFMFLSANNNLRERSLPSLGMRQCETACRRWIRNRGHRQEGPLAGTTTQYTQIHNEGGYSQVWSSFLL